jgi:hypothetical protein
MSRRGFLGWDVGAWHCQHGSSRDALVLLADDGSPRRVGESWRGNLRADYNGHAGAGLLAALLKRIGQESGVWTELVIAIDTPLGWPDAFRALLAGRAPNDVADTKAGNELLMRYTERWLAQRGHRPLSAVQDLIGSQSTKGIAVLSALGLSSSRAGIWEGRVGTTRVVAIEAYPAPCVGSAFIQAAKAPLGAGRPPEHTDIVDALTCALVAWAFATRRAELAAPDPAASVSEGWIWLPRDCVGPPGAPP